ncbi:selenide, water dikinase SelD [Paraglaciecola sp. MB-3u-78]|uniref:selenide, water dikinase SelD n=1 Tax=Paraglaciecola sp. MB-3u-78 TaxID=2058332 RepID=UPI000C32EBD3|nr:selenide, water dikinase SelD [Paraglaciecola sp. MB-3u-78]PKG98329.1 selenide, water dikinase SelD [Paraglaciecola sp. MB-3u-78]
MHEHDLVFIGGGHSHSLVLRILAMKPIKNVRLTLITDTLLTPYSGMLPGYIAGHYSEEETHLDLNKLCKAAQVRLIHGRVNGIDVANKTIQLENQASIGYDKVSINTGSTPNVNVEGAREFAVGVKPVSQLTATWRKLLAEKTKDTNDKSSTQNTAHWAVIGGGAAGIEMVLAIAYRFKQAGEALKLSLVQSGAKLLPGSHKNVQKQVTIALKQYDIDLITGFRVSRVTKNEIESDTGNSLSIQRSIWCTPATAPIWPKLAGLDTDESGFIAVNQFLQSTSHKDVFACGDVATMVKSPRPKAGVYAVRSAPFLTKNIRAAFSQQVMTPVSLQTDFLSLISLGGKNAVGQRSWLSLNGEWVWRWKDQIDQKFMALFSKNLPAMPTMNNEPMHCAGCGSKIGPELLSDTLKELSVFPNKHFDTDLTQAEDAPVAAVINNTSLLQSIDGFRAFSDDDYKLGIAATHHAVNDLYAMGLQPTSAQVWANLKFSHPRLTKRDFKRLMQGVTETLLHHETTLVGGHSTEGIETHLALVVNATGDAYWQKNALQEGDWLLLNKPLGSGLILAADAQGKATTQSIEALWRHLLQSNRAFFLTLKNIKVHAATDVTGFGLIGHLLEMLKGTPFGINITTDSVPLINGALELSRQGFESTLLPQLMPMLHQCHTNNVDLAVIKCLLDPQTNGGLLVSVSADVGRDIMSKTGAVKIGEVYRAQRDKKILQLS